MGETILTSEAASSSSQLNSSSRIICRVCQKQFSQYTCPRCNTRYCSLPCYKSHSLRCTESFMRENVMGELQQLQSDEGSKQKMLDILKRFHSEDEADAMDGDDSPLSAETIQKVLSGEEINFDDLSAEERKHFQRAVASGELSKLIKPWEPWWLKPSARNISLGRDGAQLVQPLVREDAALSSEDDIEGGPLHGIPLGPDSPLPSVCKLSAAKPSPLLAIHLVDIMYSYCFTLRLYNGDWQSDPIGSATVLLSVSSVLGQGDALRGRYIRRLTAVIIHHVPAFWKVSVSVFSGKFAKTSQVSSDSNVNVSAKRTEEKVGDGKYSSHSLDEVAGMLQSTLSAYESEVQNTFRDLEESNILCPYMNDAIKEISKACQAFEAKESAPPVAVTALRALQSEVTKVYILRLCSWMRTTTEKISTDESWVPVSILERNRSPYTISSLPLAFRSIITFSMDQINLMIQSLRNEAMKSEDIFMQLQEIQESVRLAFLNCLLNFAGQLGHTGNQLLDEYNRESLHFQNGHAEPEEKSSDPLPGSIVDPHRQLLMVISNIGYLKDELAHELYSKYRRTWQQPRGKDEEDGDMQDLITSFSGLEENVLEQYTWAKTNLIRTVGVNYLLEGGIQWGAAPTVKGVRDAAVELLHTLVAVHAEVFAGCKPLLDKTLGILVEGLMDTFLSLFHENQDKDFTVLDVNGFCQLMLELDYFETILNPYFTHEARESLKTLQGVLLEKASESVTETIETPSHSRRPTRGSDDVLQDERQQGTSVSPDDLIALAQQYSSELLQSELERTRINTACFVESIPLDSVPESAKAAYASFRGSMDSPGRDFRGSQNIGPASFSKHRRR